MKRIIIAVIVLVLAMTAGLAAAGLASATTEPETTLTTTTETETPKKVFVCKYVGTPGVDERLQTGQNPINVSINAIPGGASVGAYFADAQGRSFVLAFDTGQPEPSVSECPGGDTPPVDVCPNLEGDQETVPEGYTLVDGLCVVVPPVDVCPNLENDQETIPEGMILDNEGNCVTPPVECPNGDLNGELPGCDAIVVPPRCPPGEGPYKGKDGEPGDQECCPDANNDQKCDVAPSPPTDVVVPEPPVKPEPPVVQPPVVTPPVTRPPTTEKPDKPKTAKPPKVSTDGPVTSEPVPTANESDGELPYTGFSLWMAFVLAAALILTGLILRYFGRIGQNRLS